MQPNSRTIATRFYRLVPRETALLPLFLTFLPWRSTSINPVPVTTRPNRLQPYPLLPIETISATTTRQFQPPQHKIKLPMFHPAFPIPPIKTLTGCLHPFPPPIKMTFTQFRPVQHKIKPLIPKCQIKMTSRPEF